MPIQIDPGIALAGRDGLKRGDTCRDLNDALGRPRQSARRSRSLPFMPMRAALDANAPDRPEGNPL